MAVPIHQALKVGAYVVKQHLLGRKRYPLVLMLEPLFRCNLACAGCGKIDYPAPILNQRLSVAECLEAVDECGAPVVVIAGGEPLLHKEIDEVVRGIIARRKFVIVCTNALLLEKKLHLFKPNRYFTWSVHLDGLREIGAELGRPSYLIEDAGDLRPEWFTGIGSVGLTAGASAPDALVQDVIAGLQRIGAVEITTMQGVAEDVSFRLPPELADDSLADESLVA